MKKPANHTICRLLMMADCHFVGAPGFEPGTPWSQTRYTTGLCYTPKKISTVRREGDSNPRYPYEYVSLANWWFQPLTHPSFRCETKFLHCCFPYSTHCLNVFNLLIFAIPLLNAVQIYILSLLLQKKINKKLKKMITFP